MITDKQTLCTRWVWAYVSRYAHSNAREIAGATLDYGAAEIARALADLERAGHVVYEAQHKGGMRGYVAVIPFVMQAPQIAVVK